MPSDSWVKAQGDSCRARASSWASTKAQLGAQHRPSPTGHSSARTQPWNWQLLRAGLVPLHTQEPPWQLHRDSSTKTQAAGSSPSVCPKMLSKELLQSSLHNPLSVGWRMFLRKLEVLPCFRGAEAGCGKGWWAGQRTCLLSPLLLCWTPLLCTPSQYNGQLSLPSWQGNWNISMP